MGQHPTKISFRKRRKARNLFFRSESLCFSYNCQQNTLEFSYFKRSFNHVYGFKDYKFGQKTVRISYLCSTVSRPSPGEHLTAWGDWMMESWNHLEPFSWIYQVTGVAYSWDLTWVHMNYVWPLHVVWPPTQNRSYMVLGFPMEWLKPTSLSASACSTEDASPFITQPWKVTQHHFQSIHWL